MSRKRKNRKAVQPSVRPSAPTHEAPKPALATPPPAKRGAGRVFLTWLAQAVVNGVVKTGVDHVLPVLWP